MGGIRRIEVITGTGRRRWSAETKAQIIAESFAGAMPVSEVARRHGLRPQQLFGWRHQARHGELAVNGDDKPAFVPVVADGSGGGAPLSRTFLAGSAIEIEIAGMIVRVRGRVAADTPVEVLVAVKSAVIVPPGGRAGSGGDHPVDFRKGMDGLAAVAKETLAQDPFSGTVLVFRAKRADRVKLLFWDGSGLLLVSKRLEQGMFKWPPVMDGIFRQPLHSRATSRRLSPRIPRDRQCSLLLGLSPIQSMRS